MALFLCYAASYYKSDEQKAGFVKAGDKSAY